MARYVRQLRSLVPIVGANGLYLSEVMVQISAVREEVSSNLLQGCRHRTQPCIAPYRSCRAVLSRMR